jgi:hypothetical protein
MGSKGGGGAAPAAGAAQANPYVPLLTAYMQSLQQQPASAAAQPGGGFGQSFVQGVGSGVSAGGTLRKGLTESSTASELAFMRALMGQYGVAGSGAP